MKKVRKVNGYPRFGWVDIIRFQHKKNIMFPPILTSVEIRHNDIPQNIPWNR